MLDVIKEKDTEAIDCSLKEGAWLLLGDNGEKIELALCWQYGCEIVIRNKSSAIAILEAGKYYKEHGMSDFWLEDEDSSCCLEDEDEDPDCDEIDCILRREYNIKAVIQEGLVSIHIYFNVNYVKELNAPTFYEAYKMLQNYARGEMELIKGRV
jgi:hypothetical protein